jgi:hypothetical protein
MGEDMSKAVTAPSTAARPDLDWSQVRETMLMMNLAIAQMEMAMRDSGDSVAVLTDSFTAIHGGLMSLVEAVRGLPDSPIKQSIATMGGQVSTQMRQAIVAFQFYDRMSQRLTHVSHSLEQLAGIVGDPARLYNPNAWHALQQQIRSKYTMEDEKLMFDTLLATGDVRQALALYVERKQQASSGGDIELF